MIKTEIKGLWFGEDVIDGMKTELEDALFTGAERIAERAKSLVHVGPGVPMHLKETIRARRARKEKWKPGAFVFAGDRLKGVYWHFMLEYGTYGEEAHPYMRPAVDQNFNAVAAESKRAVQREINKKRRVSAKTKRIQEGKKR